MSDISQTFVAYLARALNAAEVPCGLWGHCLLSLHGVPSIIGAIDFVIPDGCLEAGARVLAQCVGLIPCPNPQSCPATSPERHSQPPAFHAHLDSDPEVTAGLYVYELGLSPYFAHASDRAVFPPRRPGRGLGVFKSATDDVVAPKSHVLLEAYMRLFARDHGKRVGSIGIAMIAYMQLYVDADGFLDANLLPEPLRTSYRDLQEGKKPIRKWASELKDALRMVGGGTSSPSAVK